MEFTKQELSGTVEARSGVGLSGGPRTTDLLEWAWLGHAPKHMLVELENMTLEENWELPGAAPDPQRPFPILFRYLRNTFARLVNENKVLVNLEAQIAAFNTGLLDRQYEEVYAVFAPNNHPRLLWRWVGFCAGGQGPLGKKLAHSFSRLPERPNYYREPEKLVYDIRLGAPQDNDWEHLLMDRLDRFPEHFLRKHWPATVPYRSPHALHHGERERLFRTLRHAINSDPGTRQAMVDDLNNAVQRAFKRVQLNRHWAVPHYFPPADDFQMLLPLCLAVDGRVDLVLVVERTPVDTYRGVTVLPLDWAYANARLLNRLDVPWLVSASEEQPAQQSAKHPAPRPAPVASGKGEEPHNVPWWVSVLAAPGA